MSDINLEQLKLLREPFKASAIGKLPKPTAKQTAEVKADFKKGIRCEECGGWHHPKVVHLDYVGHAALTDRFLEVDPLWNWDFVAVDSVGSPIIDNDGGFWINLTICGVTRKGYGDAQGKTGGNATKERIGDALRNAAMRFGAALDLWHKGDLHDNSEVIAGDKSEQPPTQQSAPAKVQSISESQSKYLGEIVAKVNYNLATLLKQAGVNSISDFPADRYTAACDYLKSLDKEQFKTTNGE